MCYNVTRITKFTKMKVEDKCKNILKEIIQKVYDNEGNNIHIEYALEKFEKYTSKFNIELKEEEINFLSNLRIEMYNNSGLKNDFLEIKADDKILSLDIKNKVKEIVKKSEEQIKPNKTLSKLTAASSKNIIKKIKNLILEKDSKEFSEEYILEKFENYVSRFDLRISENEIEYLKNLRVKMHDNNGLLPKSFLKESKSEVIKVDFTSRTKIKP